MHPYNIVNEPMKSLKSYQRLMIFLLLALGITCLISPWMALGADLIAMRWPSLISERIRFSRVFNRAFIIAGVIIFILARRLLIPAELKTLLAVKWSDGARQLIAGWGLAAISMTLLVTVMAAARVFTPFFRLSAADSLSQFARAFAAGVFAGSLEEIFFRGILFSGLRSNGQSLKAYLFANLFYSLLHFVKPGDVYFLNGVEPLAGFRHLLMTFEPLLDPLPLLPGILGLFLIGVVLSYALARTGNLYLSIGLHAGWILSLKMIRVFGDFTREDLGWVFGSANPKIVSGVATWIGILVVGLTIRRLTRSGSQLAAA
jgi:membrane protease YdiL (CAAX protease family)